jgi:hypothetical protein
MFQKLKTLNYMYTIKSIIFQVINRKKLFEINER